MKFRLPTEAEWEFAARGGNQSRGYKYSGSNYIDEVAWYEGNSNQTTHPVMLKNANEIGIYDMTGNVWEWCEDTYGHSDKNYFIRGGCWNNESHNKCRVSYMESQTRNRQYNCLGLRLALNDYEEELNKDSVSTSEGRNEIINNTENLAAPVSHILYYLLGLTSTILCILFLFHKRAISNSKHHKP